MDSIIPFGVYKLSKARLPILEAAVHTDEEIAGNIVATQILNHLDTMLFYGDGETLGIYINHDSDIPLLTDRYQYIRKQATTLNGTWQSWMIQHKIKVDLQSCFKVATILWFNYQAL